MAKKKAASSAPKAAPKKSAVKKTATKKAAPKKKSAPKKKAGPKASASKVVAKKKTAAAVKLTDKQVELLKKVAESKTSGYLAPKAEGKALTSLQTKKLIKRGVKDKESGNYRFLVTKTGEKQLSPQAAPSA
jgi:hypothetical protein